MTKIMYTTLVILVMTLVAGTALLVDAVVSQNAINEAEAREIAHRTIVGQITEVELEDNSVYEVEVQKDGVQHEISISANTGEVLHVEEDDDDEGPDVPITGPAYGSASEAALAYIGEGRVTDSEVGDEEGYYEIEIRLDNGREVDVHLDKDFNVLSTEYD